MTRKIPAGFATVTPTLNINGAAKAIALYDKAFGASEDYRMECPETGKVMHACLSVGDSKLFVADAMPEMGCGTPSNSTFYLYVDDVDAAYKQAKQVGLSEVMQPEDMFWGDRVGGLKDAFGIQWTLATHVRDVSPAEMEKGRDAWMQKMKAKKAA